MEFIMAAAIGLLTACGIYLLLRAQIFSLVFGLTLLSYAVNLFLFAMGRLSINAAPLIDGAKRLSEDGRYADPLPQALVLTAIVIGFAMTAFVVVLALRARGEWGDDNVDPPIDHTDDNTAEDGR
jgi:multicomponent K+:H+ antiporter subunit C